MLSRKALVWVLLAVVALTCALLLPLPWQDVTRIRNVVVIAQPPAVVFDYVSTPANWPAWHPSSLGVSGATDHPLVPGERVNEIFLVAGRRGLVTWTVTDRRRPTAWVIEGEIDGRRAGTVAYLLTPVPQGTRFEREFRYVSPTLLFAILNRLVLRHQIEAESAQALLQLRQQLEQAVACAFAHQSPSPLLPHAPGAGSCLPPTSALS